MSPETVSHAWEWLLGLSKVQLIVLGIGLSLLVAVSKVLRFLFILGFLVIFLTVLIPELAKRYEQSPVAPLMNALIQNGTTKTQESLTPLVQPEAPDSAAQGQSINKKEEEP